MPKQNKNKDPFAATKEYRKVTVTSFPDGVYMSVNNGNSYTEVIFDLKQTKALRKALKQAEEQARAGRRGRDCF